MPWVRVRVRARVRGGRAHPPAVLSGPVHAVAVRSSTVEWYEPGPPLSAEDGGEVAVRSQVVLGVSVAVDRGVVLEGHPKVEPDKGHEDREQHLVRVRVRVTVRVRVRVRIRVGVRVRVRVRVGVRVRVRARRAARGPARWCRRAAPCSGCRVATAPRQ